MHYYLLCLSQIIMREEIGSAQNQSGISAKRFDKTPNSLVLSPQPSDLDVSGDGESSLEHL